MGLNYPDLNSWRHWQASQQPKWRHLARQGKARLASAEPAVLVASVGPAPVRCIVAVEAVHRSVALAVAAPVRHLSPEQTMVVLPRASSAGAGQAELLPPGPWTITEVKLSQLGDLLTDRAPTARVVLAAGHYTPIGSQVFAWARARQVPYFVAQHGLLTPYAPPLPPAATVLAWSSADAEFWSQGRTDLSVEVVGSQLLWTAAQTKARSDPTKQPVFLGQLHGAELPTAGLARAAEEFCLSHQARYRPHPSENDRRSRAIHRRWRRLGIEFEESGRSLADLAAPVVGVFSTGLAEAAAAGLSVRVFYPDPPAWVTEFWQRYQLSTQVQTPEDSSAVVKVGGGPAVSPARKIAITLARHAGETTYVD